MPTYTYRCTNPDCLYEQDVFHSIHGGGSYVCPLCDSTMGKLVGTPPHRFKQKRGTMGITTNRGDRGIDRDDISF